MRPDKRPPPGACKPGNIAALSCPVDLLMRRSPLLLAFSWLTLIWHGSSFAAATTLELAHQLPERERVWLERLVERFRRAQPDVDLRLVHQPEATPSAAMLLLDRTTASALGGEKTFRPFHELASLLGRGFDSRGLIAETAAPIIDDRGRLLALPIAPSTAVLLYNRTAFRAAGVDPERPPSTWFEVQEVADKLFETGSRCPLTVARPSRMLIEQTSLWHGEPLFGRARQPVLNGLLQVKHLATMASWFKSRFLVVFGRGDEADEHFAGGECGMIVTGSHLFPVFQTAGIDVGVARLPYHEGYFGAPAHTVADGRALWIGRGRSKVEYRAVARFVQFLMRPETQDELVRAGGFLPFSRAGRAAFRALPTTTGTPQQTIALAQIEGARVAWPTRLAPPARQVLDEELEAVWADRKPAKEALDTAVARIAALPARDRP